jgi:hypothetical protein
MMKFNFTKQFITAAVVASVSFFGCQKSEMDEVDTLMASNTNDVIILDGLCGQSDQVFTSKRITGNPSNASYVNLTLGEIEVGNTKSHLIVQFASDYAIKSVDFTVNGVRPSILIDEETGVSKTYIEDEGRKVLQIPVLRNDNSSSAIISNFEITVYTTNSNGNSTTADGNRILENGVTASEFNYDYSDCPIECASWDKDYWKQNPGEWPNIFVDGTLKIGGSHLNKEELLILLSTGNAGRNAMKLAQSYTVARLNKASSGKSDLDEAILAAESLLGNTNIFEGTDIGKITPGLIGKLHQLPSCN